MRKNAFVLMFGCVALSASLARADVIGFVNNCTGNSLDWRAQVDDLGLGVNENIDFETHPEGELQGGHYSGSEGVSMTSTGFLRVINDAGPGQGNTVTPPLCDGEGVHGVNHHARAGISTMTFSFINGPVHGGGVFLIDLYNPDGVHPVKIEAFDGQNATGNLLGTFEAAGFNFQSNKLYFMGIVSTDGDIRSIRISATGGAGDAIGLDNFRFTTAGGDKCTYATKKFKQKKCVDSGCPGGPVQCEIQTEQTCGDVGECAPKISRNTKCANPGEKGKCTHKLIRCDCK